MPEKQKKLLDPLSDDVIEYTIFPFMEPKELGPIRLVAKRLNFLSEAQYQSHRLLDYVDKGKLKEAKVLLKSYPNILKHVEHQEQFIASCLREGLVNKIKLLLDHRPDFVLNRQHRLLFFFYLLNYGVKANQDAAELLIKKNPQLLLLKGDVVDDSGRYFKNVSFLQVISYCLDVLYMGGMVYRALPKDEEVEELRIELSLQLDELLSKGLSFELKIGDYLPKTKQGQSQKKELIEGIKQLIELKYLSYEFKEGTDDTLIIKNEKHFDLSPLIKALQDYAINCDHWDGEECSEFLRTIVGLLQTLLPLYVRQHYCDPNEAYYPMPTFDKKEFKRYLDFYYLDSCIYLTNKAGVFDGSSEDLGLNFGLIRGADRAACRRGWAVYAPEARFDSDALSALFERRSGRDLISLIEAFKKPLIEPERTAQFGL